MTVPARVATPPGQLVAPPPPSPARASTRSVAAASGTPTPARLAASLTTRRPSATGNPASPTARRAAPHLHPGGDVPHPHRGYSGPLLGG